MPRPRKSIPSYRRHKPSGNAYSDFTDPLTGRRRTVCLGPWDTPESRAEHARLCAEVAAGRPEPGGRLTVNELLLVFLRHAQQHYRRADGTNTDELANYKQVLRLVRETHGHSRAASFGPLALKAVRQRMIDKGWSGTTPPGPVPHQPRARIALPGPGTGQASISFTTTPWTSVRRKSRPA